MTDQHRDDLLLALALNDVDDAERELTLRHLARCDRCRNEYDALSATIEQTLAAAPRVEPRPGFENRVLTAMEFDDSAAAPAPGPARHRWRRWQLVAASLVVGLGLGAGGAIALSQTNDSRQVEPAPGSSSLQTADGEQVGLVTPSHANGKQVLVVTVTSGRAGNEYLCLLELKDGSQVETGTWVLGPDPGQTWVVETPETSVTEVVLVAKGGAGPVWSTATL